MPGGTDKDGRQQLIALRVDPELLAEIDAKRGRMSRSEFLRNAVYSELEALGTSLPPSVTAAPDRAGKGGRPKKEVADPHASTSPSSIPATKKASPAKKKAR